MPVVVRRHSWLLVLVVGTVLFILEERTLVSTRNPNFVPSGILLGASIVPVAFLAFVYGRRLPYDVPGGVVAVAALLGGLIGTIVAGTLEYDVLARFGVVPMLAVGLIEETSKLLVPLVLCHLLGYRSRADGLLIGVACGAGFATLETMGYAFVAMVQSRGSVTATVDLLLVRGLLSPAGHMAWTGIAAAALYSAAAAGWRGRQAFRFVLAFAGAVVLHALWDGLGTLAAFAVLAAVSLGLLTLTAHVAAREDLPGRPPESAPARRQRAQITG